MTLRRTLLRAIPAAATGVYAAMLVDQHIDPIDLVPVEDLSGEAALPNSGILLPRFKWRVIGPPNGGALVPCDDCGTVHQVDGEPIYTIGCNPAAFPAGTRFGDFRQFPVTDDAHPGVIALPNCPDTRHSPHVHAPTDYRWVD